MFNPLAARRKSMDRAYTAKVVQNENRERDF